MAVWRLGGITAVFVAVSVLASPAVQARDAIDGTPGDDVLTGTPGRDVIDAKAGVDQVAARAGSDEVKGAKGRDTVSGGPDKDSLFGGRGGDRLMGRRGPDFLVGGLGNDRVIGGPGKDHFGNLVPNFGFQGDDVLIGGRGIDLFLEDGFGDDVLWGGPNRRDPGARFPVETFRPAGGADMVFGGSGPDSIFLGPDGRVDAIHCGPGDDRVTYVNDRDDLDLLYGCERVEVSSSRRYSAEPSAS
jgi:Ca2+-binding RTX toxin-like protein